MEAELTPSVVAVRLEQLRRLYVPERLDEARARLARERPRVRLALEVTAARGLAELRALCELTRQLHAGAAALGPSTRRQ